MPLGIPDDELPMQQREAEGYQPQPQPQSMSEKGVKPMGRALTHNWSNIDWSKSTPDIAAEKGASESHVRRMRARLCPESKKVETRGFRECAVCGNRFHSRREKATCSEACLTKFHSEKGKSSVGYLKKGMPKAIAFAKSEKNRERLSRQQAGVPNVGRAAKGSNNACARTFHLRSPDGRSFSGRNVNEFVRENPNLFLPDDVVWKEQKWGIAGKRHRCRATVGLSGILRGHRGSWKGWTVNSLTEAFHNAGCDIIERDPPRDS